MATYYALVRIELHHADTTERDLFKRALPEEHWTKIGDDKKPDTPTGVWNWQGEAESRAAAIGVMTADIKAASAKASVRCDVALQVSKEGQVVEIPSRRRLTTPK